MSDKSGMPSPESRARRQRATARRAWPLVCGLLLSTAVPRQAEAQSAENKAAARALGVEGIKLANAGNCEAAIEKLSRAEALYHAPTILGRLGECQVALGKLVEGTENLNRVVREQLPANAPAAFQQARERAQRVLDEALPKIAKLRIVVEPNVEGLSVRVGDKPVPTALLGAQRPTDPGKHLIVAEAPGYLPASAEVTLAEGGEQTVSLSLVADASAAQPAAAAVDPAAQAPVPPAQQQGQPMDSGAAPPDHTLAYVLWGAGGAGLLVGSITGIMAMGKKGDLDDQCSAPERCPPRAQDTIDSANSLALISTIGFGVGIAGAAAGTVLYLTNQSPAAAVGEFRVYGATARPYLGPGAAGLVGSF